MSFSNLNKGGFFGFLEKTGTGTNLGVEFDKLGKHINKYGTPGSNPLADEGLNGLRGLNSTYQQNINAGGLTPALNRSFDLARGGLADTYARSGRSLQSALAARRAQSGGALTAGAVADLTKEGEAKSEEQYFGAQNDLQMNQATLGYNSTKDFYSKINDNMNSIASAGLTREQQQLMAKLQLASLRIERNKGISSATSGILGGIGG